MLRRCASLCKPIAGRERPAPGQQSGPQRPSRGWQNLHAVCAVCDAVQLGGGEAMTAESLPLLLAGPCKAASAGDAYGFLRCQVTAVSGIPAEPPAQCGDKHGSLFCGGGA